ncbi:MAG: DUF3368 domain-containing protein [Saprospiraceae bacterium]|nr:DUF3368 domain-containing protein [Saprospiraceae bacterium]
MVFDEITIQGAGMPGADEIREAIWIEVIDGKNKALFTALRKIVDPGEAEAIVVAMETGADLLLIDERLGRQVAKDYDIPVLGILGILKIAKKKSCINLVKPLLDRLISEAGFRVSANLYREVLTDVGES